LALTTAHIRPLTGKTFSLQGTEGDSENYYSLIASLADALLEKYNGGVNILSIIQNYSGKRRFLKKVSSGKFPEGELSPIFNLLKSNLTGYTRQVKAHLEGLTLKQRFEKTISTIEEQYHLYMLEIELVSRLNKDSFKSADVKLAFLPHCLHDLDKDCKAKVDGIDYVCRKCSKVCYIKKVTQLLNEHNIKAYIWRTAKLKSLFRKLRSQFKTIGVLGVACIPELINGMRMCSKAEIPVVGIPLDANRCRRWMGEFYPTAVNLSALKRLIS
jgi:hypothetical protein